MLTEVVKSAGGVAWEIRFRESKRVIDRGIPLRRVAKERQATYERLLKTPGVMAI